MLKDQHKFVSSFEKKNIYVFLPFLHTQTAFRAYDNMTDISFCAIRIMSDKFPRRVDFPMIPLRTYFLFYYYAFIPVLSITLNTDSICQQFVYAFTIRILFTVCLFLKITLCITVLYILYG